MTTVPAHSLSAPARALQIAAARFIPGVCAVLGSKSSACTIRTPRRRQSVSLVVTISHVSRPPRFANGANAPSSLRGSDWPGGSEIADQPVPGGEQAGQGAVGNPDLGIDVLNVMAGRPARNDQPLSDVGVFESEGQQLQHFNLARSE